MALKRLIPCLLFDGTNLIKTVRFRKPCYIGNPINAIKIYNDKEVDELVLLDVRATSEGRSPDFAQIEVFAAECFMPFTYGGGVASLEDFHRLFALGVEKVVVNSLLFSDPQVVREATARFGSQSVVAAVDVRRSGWPRKRERVFSHAGLGQSPEVLSFCLMLQDQLEVGEILLTSVDREGTWQGYDVQLVRRVVTHVSVPVIAHGGAGCIADLSTILSGAGAAAAALGSMAVYQKKGMGVLIGFPRRERVLDEPTPF